MAARLAGDNVRRMYSRSIIWAPMRRGVTKRRWKDLVIPAMLRRDPVVAWVIDDTELPKKGSESGGVARQYGGQVGKQANCRLAVSLSVTSEKASMPVTFRGLETGRRIRPTPARKGNTGRRRKLLLRDIKNLPVSVK